MKKEQKLSILTVDDLEANVILMQQFIELGGYETDTAHNGTIALEKLESKHYDIVFLDLMMPKISGLDVLQYIKSKSHLKDIYVIVVSANVDSEQLAQSIELGAFDYIKKPLSKVEFLARLKSIIRTKMQEDDLRLLNEQLASKNRIISESIKSASFIQKSIFPTEEEIIKTFPSSFIFLKPKYELSGDFFWIHEKGGIQIIIEADCTGHSIAGAMLSIIANIIINQIVETYNICEPSAILNRLNAEFSNALNRYNLDMEEYLFDGMDISIATIDKRTQTISFAAAHQSMYVFDKNNQLTIIHGDEYSIGYGIHGKYYNSFVQKDLDLKMVSRFIFYSDGIVDQYGNNNTERFSRARLTKLISDSIPDFTLSKLVSVMASWQGNTAQTDDMLLLSVVLK